MPTVQPDGEKIRKERDLKELSQEELASNAGVHPRTVWNVEKGARAKKDTIERIAKALDRDYGYFFPQSKEVTSDAVLGFRQSYRVLMTELMAMYYRNLYDNLSKEIPNDIPVISESYFLPEKPFDVEILDNRLEWEEEFIKQGSSSKFDMASILENEELYNGLIYRILDMNDNFFRFSQGRYFDFLNTSECLSYELSNAIVSNNSIYDILVGRNKKTFQRVISLLLRNNSRLLPIRYEYKPLEFRSRVTAFGTCTLVVIKRARKSSLFVLNRRSDNLSETPGLMHVIPAGTFQPNMHDDHLHDYEFSFKENIIREFVEELLDDKLLRGNAPPVFSIDDMYNEKGNAFRKKIINENYFYLFYLGLVVDPINLKPEILTVFITHEGYLQGISGKSLESSWETKKGELMYYDFTKDKLIQIMNEEYLVPTGKAHLWLTVQHFDHIASNILDI